MMVDEENFYPDDDRDLFDDENAEDEDKEVEGEGTDLDEAEIDHEHPLHPSREREAGDEEREGHHLDEEDF